VAYHSGELTPASRRVVEACYRDGALKVLCCTSTLAAGVNLPCATVIIVALVDPAQRTFPLDLVQYEQIAGRAGRGGSKGAAKGKVHIIAKVPVVKGKAKPKPELLASIADALPNAKGPWGF
jgi:replicative superfamily II helicase